MRYYSSSFQQYVCDHLTLHPHYFIFTGISDEHEYHTLSYILLLFGVWMLCLATVSCLSVSSFIGITEEQLNWLLGCKMCRTVQLLPGKHTLNTQPLDSHLFLKDSGNYGKALPEQIAGNSSFIHNKIISVIIALTGQKLRKTIDDFYKV